MSTGILGQAFISGGSIYSTVYTVPALIIASTFNINVANTTSGTITVRIGITTSVISPGTGEFIEYDTPIVANGVLERGGIVAQPGQRVLVSAPVSGLSVSVYGFEE